MITNEEITTILNDNSEPQQACDSLIAAANSAGGEDNITALIIGV